MTTISKTNVRYITGSSKKVNGATVAIKFRVFAISEVVLSEVTKRLSSLKETGLAGKLTSPKYNGWNLKENLFFKEYIAKDRAEFQTAFKKAKSAAIEATTILNALETVKKEETEKP